MECDCGNETTMTCGACGKPICVGCSDWGLCDDCRADYDDREED
jgi:hypothetical protein